MEAKVPMKAKNIVGPMFSKKEDAFMLKPASEASRLGLGLGLG